MKKRVTVLRAMSMYRYRQETPRSGRAAYASYSETTVINNGWEFNTVTAKHEIGRRGTSLRHQASFASHENFPLPLARHLSGQRLTIPGPSVGAARWRYGIFSSGGQLFAHGQHRRQRRRFSATRVPLCYALKYNPAYAVEGRKTVRCFCSGSS